MTAVSYLADSPSVFDSGEFSSIDILNRKYTITTSASDVRNILVVGKGPNQSSRESVDDEVDMIVLARVKLSYYSSYTGCVIQSSYGSRTYVMHRGSNIQPFVVSKIPDGRNTVTINFDNDLDIENYVFRYLLTGSVSHRTENSSSHSLNFIPSNDTKTSFEYAIVNKLNYPILEPQEIRDISPFIDWNSSKNYTEINFDSSDSIYSPYLTNYDYICGKSVMFGDVVVPAQYSNFDSGVMLSWPKWVEPKTYDESSDGKTVTCSAYWFGVNSTPQTAKKCGELITITDKFDANGKRSSMNVRISNVKTRHSGDGSNVIRMLTVSNA